MSDAIARRRRALDGYRVEVPDYRTAYVCYLDMDSPGKSTGRSR